MTDLATLEKENRRWEILKLLAGDPDHQTESRLLQRALGSVNPLHNVGLDAIRDEIRWLENHMLVKVDIVGDHVLTQLTQHGLDVAEGRKRVTGVDRDGLA